MKLAELTLIDARARMFIKRGHAEIAEIGADAQPVELLGGLDLPQRHVSAAEVLWRAEAFRQRGMLIRDLATP